MYLSANTLTEIQFLFWYYCYNTAFFAILAYSLKYQPSPNRAINFTRAHKEPFWNNETLCELSYPLLYQLFLAPFIIALYTIYQKYILQPYFPYHIFQNTILSYPKWIQAIIALIIMDLSVYIRHRFVHKFSWAFHAVHHCTKKISWSTGARLHPVDVLIMALIDVFILHLIGFQAKSIAVAGVLVSAFNSFNHSNMILDYGVPFRYIFVSPNMHRWHHATALLHK